MDNINLRILRALSINGRISIAELAREVHLSAPAVAGRVKRLEQEGIIVGYKPQINLEKIGIPIRALIECKVHRAMERTFRAHLLTFDEIIKIYNITGITTFIVEVGVKDLSKLESVLDRMIDFCDTNTSIVTRMTYDEDMPKALERILKAPPAFGIDIKNVD